MTDNIHKLPNANLAGTVEALPEIVRICEDILQLAKEGKIRAIAHAYVTHGDTLSTGWQAPEKDLLLAAAIHRLAWRYEDEGGDGDPTVLPSERA